MNVAVHVVNFYGHEEEDRVFATAVLPDGNRYYVTSANWETLREHIRVEAKVRGWPGWALVRSTASMVVC